MHSLCAIFNWKTKRAKPKKYTVQRVVTSVREVSPVRKAQPLSRSRSRSFDDAQPTVEKQPPAEIKLPTIDEIIRHTSRSHAELYRSKESGLERPLRLRANSECRSRLGTKMGLKPVHQRAILESWLKICNLRQARGTLFLMEKVLEKLCAKEAFVKNTFVHNAFLNSIAEGSGHDAGMKVINDHAKFLLWLLNETIANLDKSPDVMYDTYANIGSKHGKLTILGFSDKYLDKFGETFVEVMVLQDSVRQRQDAAKAWTILIAGMIDGICMGFQRKQRVENRHRNSLKLYDMAMKFVM